MKNTKVEPSYLTVFFFFFLDKLVPIHAMLQLSGLTIANCSLSSNASLHTTITHNLLHPPKALPLYNRIKQKTEKEEITKKKKKKLACAILTIKMPYHNPLSIPQFYSAQRSPHYYLYRQQNTQPEDLEISPSPVRLLRLSYLSLPLPLARVLGA